jgi:hypothetical protein
MAFALTRIKELSDHLMVAFNILQEADLLNIPKGEVIEDDKAEEDKIQDEGS